MTVISVITVCFNELPRRIQYTLDSIIEQDYSAIEIVVVDGGSGEPCIRAFDPYKRKLGIFISESDRGIYDAMNKGISAATGEWIIFMNVGDRFHSPTVLTQMLTAASDHSADLIYGDVIRIEASSNTRLHQKAVKNLSRWFMYNETICHQAILVKRRAFRSIGFFDIDLKLIADRDWIFRFMQKRLVVAYKPVIVCDWELGGACDDYIMHEEELKVLRSRYYNYLERFVYALVWLAIKIYRRIRSLNFKPPIPH